MNGFITIISTQNNNPLNIPVFWKQPFDFQSSFVHRKWKGNNYQIEQYTSKKFENEKLRIETTNFLCITEGIIQNLNDLCKLHTVKDAECLISKHYENKNNTFFSEFEGNYTGVFYDKQTNTWTAFNNKTGMKKVYYFQNSDYVIFASDLKTLTQCLKTLDISYSLNEESVYQLLTSGFMHEDLTLINEVKQLRAGEYCNFKTGILQVDSYFNLRNIIPTNDSKKTIIEQLDVLFKSAVKLEFDIDKTSNYKHLTTLSGGLDSRMTALIAYKMGYQNQVLLNFSEKDYADQIIAKQIAEAYKMELKQIELNAQSLVAIDDVVLVNDELTVYTACSHAFSALKQIQFPESGIIHTGMIGDAVMGSFVSKIPEKKPSITDGLYSGNLLNRAENYLKKTIPNYPNEELYKFYNRAFLGANNGFLYFDLIGESSSPFLNSSFLSYAYSIPRKYKYKENIYIEWIRTLHPDIARFTWKNIGGKPTNNSCLRMFYRSKRAIVKRLPIKTMWKNNMNPEQLWYEQNESVRKSLDTYFSTNIQLVEDKKELRDDLIKLYRTGNITEKAQVLTLLSAIKLHFE